MGIHDADLLPGPELVDARLRLRLRQPDRAEEVCGRYSAAARAKGQPWALARSARCQGLLAADEDADALFEQALSLHARTSDVFETARTQLAYGSRLGGHTTREAAAAVFLSPKTIECHLLSVYRKLGISSREQLAEILADRPPPPAVEH